jgi:hypothetical protein
MALSGTAVLKEIKDAKRSGRREGISDERAACAELVRSKGCICARLRPGPESVVSVKLGSHDPACPIILAAAIEARGKE